LDSSAVENPAYWRIVQACPAYIVARGPRRNGKLPGTVSVKSSASTSARV
jgi:hypothetical protein